MDIAFTLQQRDRERARERDIYEGLNLDSRAFSMPFDSQIISRGC